MPEVRHTECFDRVQALPRRRLTQRDADAAAEALTPEVVCKGSRARLRPWQALAAIEAAENNGGWLALPVGVGKTIITYILPRLFGACRPLLIVPAALREKTYADFTSYAGVWKAPNPPPRIVSREELALESRLNVLDTLRPDLILIDEADELSNRNSAAARRIDRYVVEHEEVPVVAMMGTPSRNSIMGYWHILCWCLRERAPVPHRESEALTWAAVIDNKGPRGFKRMGPGPLGATAEQAREWFRLRLLETPGVVIVDGDSAGDIPLTVQVMLAKEDKTLDAHFARFLLEMENPDGIPVSDPLSRWRIDGQLGCGLFQYWDPPPPERWRNARRDVARFVRQVIARSENSARPIDTEAQALRRHATHPTVQEWLEVRDTFKPLTKVKWLSSSTIETAVEWLRESEEPSIIWCGGVEFANALAMTTRLAYFGREGKDQNDRSLHAAPAGESFIASWQANKRGFNLQAWRRHLIVHPPQSAKWLGQIFGRSHRAGQDRPVEIYVLATSGGTLDSFDAAFREAKFSRSTVSLTQKLLRAKVVREKPRITQSNKYRWATRQKEKAQQ